ncbi:hypothetical protein F4802DRAFT_555425 [Xylaria palmicola]|nr:hypothetical protein F4802DRAFT_555425 [Xylaria palmicola]
MGPDSSLQWACSGHLFSAAAVRFSSCDDPILPPCALSCPTRPPLPRPQPPRRIARLIKRPSLGHTHVYPGFPPHCRAGFLNMARGNQREKAREKNLKAQSSQKSKTNKSGSEMQRDKEALATLMRQKQEAADAKKATTAGGKK